MFLYEDLKRMRETEKFVMKIDEQRKKIMRFYKILWRNFAQELEILGLWDKAVILVGLLDEGCVFLLKF